MSLNDFKIGRLLGKGAFGIVILVKRIIDGQIYAIKQVNISQLSDKEKNNALNEIRILASLSHKNIIGYKDAFFDEKSKTLNIVMEFADGGDMSQKIKYNLRHGLLFRENMIWNYLIQILEGLNYLHEKNIIHRDLKSANIFLTKSGTIKIGDLNVSKIAKVGMAYTQTGTPYYASPEIWLDRPYDFKSDIWSLGCILYELCQLKPPFRGTSLKNLCYNIQRGIYEPIMSFYSNELRSIIGMMLKTNPNMRPTTSQILNCSIILNKKKELNIGLSPRDLINQYYNEEQKGLIATIKMPRNLREINGNLPMNKYNSKQMREEMLKEDEYETNKRLNGFLNEEDKKEIKNLYDNKNVNKKNNYKNKNNNNHISNINNNINKNIYLNNIMDNNINIMNNKMNIMNKINKEKILINNKNENNRRNIVKNNINNNKNINKNINNSNRNYYNNDLNSLNCNLNEINNDELISLNYNLLQNRKKLDDFSININNIKNNNKNNLKKKEKENELIKNNNLELLLKANEKNKNIQNPNNIDDYISQNINIYNNINKYYYPNYLELLSYNNEYKKPKGQIINNMNINMNYNNININDNKNENNNDINKILNKRKIITENSHSFDKRIFKNKNNSEQGPNKYNYNYHNNFNNKNRNFIIEKEFKNINEKNNKALSNINSKNNSNNNEINNNNLKLLVDNNNISSNMKIYNTKKHKINDANKNPGGNINSENLNFGKFKKIEIPQFENKKYESYLEKDNLYLLSNISDRNKNKIQTDFNNIKDNNNYHKYKNNRIHKITNHKITENNSMNNQKFHNFKENKKKPVIENYKKNIQIEITENMMQNRNKNINNKRKMNNQGRIISTKTPKIKMNKNIRSNAYINGQLSINSNYSNNNSNSILNDMQNYKGQNYYHKVNNNNKFNFENYQPRLYKGIQNNKYFNNKTDNNRYNKIINNNEKNIYIKDPNEYEINPDNSNNANLSKNNNNRIKFNNINNNIIGNHNFNNNRIYKKQNNYFPRIQNDIQKRPVSSIVTRRIEPLNNRFEPSFNIQITGENDNLNNNLINSLNNYNYNNNNYRYINNNENNKIFIDNKLEISNNNNNYNYINNNKITNEYRPIQVSQNIIKNQNRQMNNKRLVTPSPHNFSNRQKRVNDINMIKSKNEINKIVQQSKSYIDINNNPNNNSNNNIQKNNFQVRNDYYDNNKNIFNQYIQPKRRGKVIIEKYNYQPVKNKMKEQKNKYNNYNNNFYNNFNNNLNNNNFNNIYNNMNINDFINDLKKNIDNENKNRYNNNYNAMNDFNDNKYNYNINESNMNLYNNFRNDLLFENKNYLINSQNNNNQRNHEQFQRKNLYSIFNNNIKNRNNHSKNICHSVGNNDGTLFNYLKMDYNI